MRAVGHLYSRWGALSHDERGLLVQLAFLLPFVALALRVAGLRRVMQRLETRAAAKHPPDAVEAQRIREVAGMVERHAPYKGNCLSRSVTLWWLLQRRGLACDLRIGVRQEKEQLLAHAWVEAEGRPLNDSANVLRAFSKFDKPIVPTLGNDARRVEWS